MREPRLSGLRRRAVGVAAVATTVTTAAHESAHLVHCDAPVPAGAVAAGAALGFVLLAVAHESLAARRVPGPFGFVGWLLAGQVVVHAALDLAAGFATGATVMSPVAGSMLAAHAAAAVVHAVGICGTHRCLGAIGVVVAAVVGLVRPSVWRGAPVLPVRLQRPPGGGTRPARRLATVLLDRGVRDRRGPPGGRAPPSDIPDQRTPQRVQTGDNHVRDPGNRPHP